MALVVIPTLREARALPLLAPGLLGQEVLVVDDASDDGTAEVAESLGWRVIRRSGRPGYSHALWEGFRWARAAGHTRVVQMDADGSHPPRLVSALLSVDADLVIGSRYVRGGSTSDWPRRRLLLSRVAGGWCRRSTGIDVRDPTAGFRAWRLDVLSAVLARPPRVDGFSWNALLTREAWRAGRSIVEVPIDFGPRVAGESKMTARMAVEGAWALARQA